MNNKLLKYIPKAFISYKWEDEAHNAWVEKLASDLVSNGIETFLDVWSVRLGDSFTEYMTSMIGKADIVLFIMTKNSVAAVESIDQGALKFELQLAMSRKLAGEQLRVIGIYKEGEKVASYLRDHRYADFRDDSNYNKTLKLLLDDLLDRKEIPKVEILPNLQTLSERHIEVLRTLTSLFKDKIFSGSDMDRKIDTHERFQKVFNNLLEKGFISTNFKKGEGLFYNVPLRTIEALRKAEQFYSPKV